RDVCSEERGACLHQIPDADGDGFGDAACVDAEGEPLGTDCDDADADRFPGNAELCDEGGHDEDCDLGSLGALDQDGDGEVSAECCNPASGGGTSCGTDCNDSRRDVLPGGTEACNGIDDDCDGMIDEGVQVTTYADADRDGVGDPATAMTACAGVAGRVTATGDCDDARPDRRPGQPEFCDLVDNDCDGTVDESAQAVPWYRDADGDGFGDPTSSTLSCTPVSGASLLGTDCNDAAAAIHPAAAELCDGLDNDCSGGPDYRIAPGDYEDDDGDGYVDILCGAPLGVDCRDDDALAGPGEPEACDGRDNDCDGSIDEDVASYAWYRDADGDGYGTESGSTGVVIGCVPIPGHVRRGGDCDDTTAARSPVALETCDGRDEDCDSAIDEEPASSGCIDDLGRDQACVRGGCAPVACVAGFLDCNGDLMRVPTDGCETAGAVCP
ncbi:MAG: putative metal-binding motif-containing protein, partial [Actinomycetota bacterium]|nr:putative metal-binding motif-containing protein [Myxococcota bacterium]MDQ3178479.1 putative metal-binding motif-containing protein [Actinomycetota bacterium]